VRGLAACAVSPAIVDHPARRNPVTCAPKNIAAAEVAENLTGAEVAA